MVYFVVGPNGAGKTFFANYISQISSVKIFDTGPILRTIHKNSKSLLSFSEWIKVGEEQFGTNFAVGLICNAIKEQFDINDDIIIIGNRCVDGIQYIINRLHIDDYNIIYLEANYNCLKSNYEEREKVHLTYEEFNKLIEGGEQMGLVELKGYVLAHPENCFYFYREDNEDVDYLNFYNNYVNKDIKLKKKM